MIYLICSTLLLIGVLGLLAQMLLGGAHIGHMGHHAGRGHGHGGSRRHGHGQHGHAHEQHHGGSEPGPSPLWTLLSPLTFFSLCLGMGATGLLLKHLHLPAEPGRPGRAARRHGLLRAAHPAPVGRYVPVRLHAQHGPGRDGGAGGRGADRL